MREILFRGKAIDGNWYYGVPLVFTEDYICMTAPHTYNKSVIPETVGQFTGLTDKNGKKIFEGDILFSPSWWFGPRFVYLMQGNCGPCKADNVMQYVLASNVDKPEPHAIYNLWNGCEVEIIGNIHDNPELLANKYFQ